MGTGNWPFLSAGNAIPNGMTKQPGSNELKCIQSVFSFSSTHNMCKPSYVCHTAAAAAASAVYLKNYHIQFIQSNLHFDVNMYF